MEISPLSFELKQDNHTYQLNIKIREQSIIFNLNTRNDIFEEYETKLSLEELKQMHKALCILNSCQEFLDYIKSLVENKKISINKIDENKISIKIIIEYLLKQSSIDIILKKKNISFDLIAKDLYQQISILKSNYNKVNEKNLFLEEEIKDIKKENKNMKDIIIKFEEYILENNINKISNIIKDDEFIIIKKEIEERINKKIKDFKKLYQATIDGGEAINFHNKCDNIPNTLILIESAGNRRFGGFASLCWGSPIWSSNYDKNCFLFSLDKKKIYPPKNNNYYEIVSRKKEGPNFSLNSTSCLSIGENAIKYKGLKTNESETRIFDDLFNNDSNALSEDGKFDGINAKDYEVFQIIF